MATWRRGSSYELPFMWSSNIHENRPPVSARSKACACDRSIFGIVGSNPAGDMDVCFL